MFAEWIANSLKSDKSKDQSGLAAALNVDRSAISKIITGTRDLKAHEIAPTAKYLGVPPPSVSMPVRYVVGAGQECFAIDDDQALEYRNISGMWGVDAELAQVSGDSMWPFIPDGSILILGATRLPSQQDVGKLVAVKLADGRMLVKVIRRGSADGLWSLESANAPLMEDQIVSVIAPILRTEYPS